MTAAGPDRDAAAGSDGGLRRLVRPAAVAIVLESSMYSVVAPMLPHYRDELGLSTSAAGVLMGSYAAGTVIGSVAGGAAAQRLGPQRTVVAGFLLLGCATLAFGLVPGVVLLDLARALQGFGAGLGWAGLLAWVLAVTPSGRRGRALGAVMSAGIFGTLFGPVIGTAGVATSPLVVFGAVALICVLLVGWIARIDGPSPAERQRVPWSDVLRDRALKRVLLLSLLPGVILGTLNALVPLTLDRLGAGEAAIGASFLAGAAVAATMSPLAGWGSDRFGRRPFLIAGLAFCGATVALLGVVHSALAVAAVTVVTFGIGVTAFSVPLAARLSEVGEAAGVSLGAIAAALNLTFAVGEAISAPASAFAADRLGDAVPFLVLGAATLATVPFVATGRRRPAAARPCAGASCRSSRR